MSNNQDRLKGVKIGVKLGVMATFRETINTRQAVELCDQLRAELERLQLQEKTEGEQIQCFAYFTLLKTLLSANNGEDFGKALDTMQYINECEEVAKNNLIDYIRV